MAFDPGFEIAEAQAMVAMCGWLEGAPSPPLTQMPFPIDWVSLYLSPEFGIFDNVWQLLHNPKANPERYTILIRGTVDESGSIIDDLLSLMIPASGTVLGHGYNFADDPQAGVHLGFALAALLMLWDPTDGILARMAQLCPRGSDVYIAGHSQGAAIATLIRSFLSNLPPGQDLGHAYKSYVLALPKPGNSHYVSDYNAAFANAGMAYCLANSQDWVPQTPLTLEWIGDVNTPNPVSVFLSNQIILAPVTESIKLLKDARSRSPSAETPGAAPAYLPAAPWPAGPGDRGPDRGAGVPADPPDPGFPRLRHALQPDRCPREEPLRPLRLFLAASCRDVL